MGILDDAIAEDAVHAFTNTDDFAEPVTVSDGVTPRTVNAVIERFPPQVRGDPPKLVKFMVGHFANHAVDGIARTSLDTGTYTCTVAWRKGGVAEVFRLHLPADVQEHADSGMTVLELW